MKKIITVMILLFIAGAVALFFIAQSDKEEVSFPAILDPATIEANFTPTILPQITLLQNITPPYDDGKALLALNIVEQTIESLKLKNLPTQYVYDKYLEARKAYEGENITGIVQELLLIKDAKQRARALQKLNLTENSTKTNFDYDAVVLLSTDATNHAQKLHTIQERLVLLDYTISQVNRSVYNISEMDPRYAAINEQLTKEQDLEVVAEMISQSYTRLDELLIEHSRAAALLKASQRTLKNFFITNWKALIVIIIMLSIIGIIGANELRIHLLGEKINSLQIESETLEHLLKKSQADRYVAKTLTKSDYQTRMEQYKNRMTAIKHTLPVVHLRLDKAKSYRKFYFPLRI